MPTTGVHTGVHTQDAAAAAAADLMWVQANPIRLDDTGFSVASESGWSGFTSADINEAEEKLETLMARTQSEKEQCDLWLVKENTNCFTVELRETELVGKCLDYFSGHFTFHKNSGNNGEIYKADMDTESGNSVCATLTVHKGTGVIQIQGPGAPLFVQCRLPEVASAVKAEAEGYCPPEQLPAGGQEAIAVAAQDMQPATTAEGVEASFRLAYSQGPEPRASTPLRDRAPPDLNKANSAASGAANPTTDNREDCSQDLFTPHGREDDAHDSEEELITTATHISHATSQAKTTFQVEASTQAETPPQASVATQCVTASINAAVQTEIPHEVSELKANLQKLTAQLKESKVLVHSAQLPIPAG